MLRIVDVAYEVAADLRPFLAVLKKLDASLEDQLRRSLQSMTLNTSEGSVKIGKRGALLLSYGLGSAREAWSCLRLCESFGYIDSIEPYRNRFNQIIGTLVNILFKTNAA